MTKTIEATWREGFLKSDALVAPKVNDLYARKSTHIVDRIQRVQRINEIAILIGGPLVWAIMGAVGMPYGGALMCAAWVGLIVVRRQFPNITKFDAPISGDSYQYLKAFQLWFTNRLAWGRRYQRHVYPVTFIAMAIGLCESPIGQLFFRTLVDRHPGIRLVYGVPLFLIVGDVVIAIVLALRGGIIFDRDVKMYRRMLAKVDEMVAEMEALRR